MGLSTCRRTAWGRRGSSTSSRKTVPPHREGAAASLVIVVSSQATRGSSQYSHVYAASGARVEISSGTI